MGALGKQGKEKIIFGSFNCYRDSLTIYDHYKHKVSLSSKLVVTQDNHTENTIVSIPNVIVNLLKILIDFLHNSLTVSNHSFIGITFLHHNCSAEHMQ